MEAQIDISAGHVDISDHVYLETSKAYELLNQIKPELLGQTTHEFFKDILMSPESLGNFKKEMELGDVKLIIEEIDDYDISVNYWDKLIQLVSKELPPVCGIKMVDYSGSFHHYLWGGVPEEGRLYLQFESDDLFVESLTDKGRVVEGILGSCEKTYFLSGSW